MGSNLRGPTETIQEPTPPERWIRLKELFQAALDQPAANREAWVRAQAANEPELICEVLDLLAAEEEGSLDLEPGASATDVATAPLFSGLEQVGPYRINGELARGGMGRVFRATRDNPRRAAAVKLMYRALHDEKAIQRFEYESQILADLSHPNIAHVYESGTLEYLGENIPWYAMELVEGGRPLDVVLSEIAPTLERKLALFLQVCAGVHHAHQRGIIHRDLKPGNVLVGADGHVKLIDFGIAKSLGPGLDGPDAESTDLTAQGEVMGTLAYMSPEQTSSRSGALDVRVDVYALGVILYRLCTGKMPYELHRDRIREAVTTICEKPPATEPLERAALPTDVRLIILKALSKRADDRYDSVAALAADLRRFAAGQPIEARPPSLVYQLRRFAGRNRAVVGSIVAVFVALAVGAGVSTYGLIEARDARDRAEQARLQAEQDRESAEQARKSAEQARDFATEILSEADPWQSREPEITLRKVLERASQRLSSTTDLDPRTEVQARQTLLDVFDHLGDFEAAEREARRALALAEEAGLVDMRLELLNSLGDVLLSRDEVDAAEPVITQSLALHRERYGADDERTWRADMLAASVLEARGEMHPARDAYAALVERSGAKMGVDAPLRLDALGRLGAVQHAIGELDAAEAAFRAVWNARRESLGPAHPQTLMSYQELISIIVDRGRLDEADRELKVLISAFTDVLGEWHASTAGAIALRGMVLRRSGRPEEAVPLANKALAITAAVKGPDHLHTLRSRNNLALVLVDAGRHEEAEAIFEALTKSWATRDADAEGSYLVVAVNHAQLLGKTGRAKQGLAVLDAALARAATDYPPEFWLFETAASHRAKLAGESLDTLGKTIKSEKARALAGLPPETDPG